MSKLKYLISPEASITPTYLGRVLSDFQSKKLPVLNKLENYYFGKQAILKKQPLVPGKQINRDVYNYCSRIVKNYNGYLTGIPISYSNEDFQDIIDIINYNDVSQEDTEYLKNALIFGRAFEINYVDEMGKPRFKLFSTKECVPIYSNTIEEQLLYVVRFYREDLINENNENYIVEVYGPRTIDTYRSAPGFVSFTLLESRPHFYEQCPITVFSLNEDEEGIFSQITSLQDAYNVLMSSGVDDYLAWEDAYLVLTGANMDEDDLISMRANRFLQLPAADAQISFLTKQNVDTDLFNKIKEIRDQIFSITNCPNFTDENFLARSGEALKWRLVGFENQAATIENNMRKALQRRIELITEILKLTDAEEVWRDVDIRFTRNLPSSLTPTTPQELMTYKGLVSDRTLLEMVPFVKDVDKELQRLEEEQIGELNRLEFGHYEQMDSEAEEFTE